MFELNLSLLVLKGGHAGSQEVDGVEENLWPLEDQKRLEKFKTTYKSRHHKI